MSSENSVSSTLPLYVQISREIPMSWFTLTLPDGSTEDLEPDDCREWFKRRGANMDALENALDYVWNFGTYKPVTVVINNPRTVNRETSLPTNVAPRV